MVEVTLHHSEIQYNTTISPYNNHRLTPKYTVYIFKNNLCAKV